MAAFRGQPRDESVAPTLSSALITCHHCLPLLPGRRLPHAGLRHVAGDQWCALRQVRVRAATLNGVGNWGLVFPSFGRGGVMDERKSAKKEVPRFEGRLR